MYTKNCMLVFFRGGSDGLSEDHPSSSSWLIFCMHPSLALFLTKQSDISAAPPLLQETPIQGLCKPCICCSARCDMLLLAFCMKVLSFPRNNPKHLINAFILINTQNYLTSIFTKMNSNFVSQIMTMPVKQLENNY